MLLIIVAQANGNNTCSPDARADESCVDNPLLEDEQAITAVIFMMLALIFISSESELYIFKKFYEVRCSARIEGGLRKGLWGVGWGVLIRSSSQMK